MPTAAEPAKARSGRSTIQLTPMSVPKASDVLADELRERILSGEYVEGTPLPPGGNWSCRPT